MTTIQEKLREIRAAIVCSMSDAQLALLKNNLDVEAAIQWLKEQGLGGST